LPKSAWFLVVVWLVTMGCSSRVRIVAFENSSDASVGAGRLFSAPVLVTGLLETTDLIQDPSLSPDELEIYFAALKNGTYDIWMSTRLTTSSPWASAVVVSELSTNSADFEPDLSSDGLTIYFSSDRPGGDPNYRIWVAQRQKRTDPWGVPQVVNLGPTSTDRGPAVDVSGLLMVYASDHGMGNFDIYRTTRDTTTAAWGAPVNISEINSSVFDWDPAVYREGLGLVFGSRRNGDQKSSDLFESVRASSSAQFSAPQSLDELNSKAAEGDPWLSDDGRHIVFSSERSGVPRLYEAWR
jgi:Tol biopolymer transport system component